MSEPFVTLRAEEDLQAIMEYLTDRAGVRKAMALAKELQAGVEYIGHNPDACKPRPELSTSDSNVRSHVVSPYVIYFVEGDPVWITRILHGRSEPTFVTG